jgi:general secretion pathway protein K
MRLGYAVRLCLWFAVVLASALCLWFASVAPVRGGTYFLCRRKESKQRKGSHRQPLTFTHGLSTSPRCTRHLLAYVRCQRVESMPHPLHALVRQRAVAKIQRSFAANCVSAIGPHRNLRGAARAWQVHAPSRVVRQPTHCLPQKDGGEPAAGDVEEGLEVGEAKLRRAGNYRCIETCHVKCGDVGGPWVRTRAGGVSPLSLLTFFAAAKKVSAAPHRGNAGNPEANRGCQRSKKTKPPTASQTKTKT